MNKRHSVGPGYELFRPHPRLVRHVSEAYSPIQSPGKGFFVPEVRGRVMATAGAGISMEDPSTGVNYTASALASKFISYNIDMIGGYTTNPMDIAAVNLDCYAFIKEESTQHHLVPFDATTASYPGTSPLSSSGGSGLGDPLFVALSRPMASFVLTVGAGGLSVQRIRIASNASSYIVVEAKFVYDTSAYTDDNPWPGTFSDFKLVDSGGIGSGSGHVGKDGFIDIPLPTPTFDDPVPADTGYFRMPFFDISWTDFQTRYA